MPKKSCREHRQIVAGEPLLSEPLFSLLIIVLVISKVIAQLFRRTVDNLIARLASLVVFVDRRHGDVPNHT